MKEYLVWIKVNLPYPKEMDFRVSASNWATAIRRALADFRKANKGRRFKELNIRIIYYGEIYYGEKNTLQVR